MKKESAKKKAAVWQGWLLAAGIVMTFTGCESGKVDLKWQEEVKMADGQILIVNRTVKGQKFGGPWGEGGGWKTTERVLEVVKLPQDWPSPPVWRTEDIPILFDYQPEEHTWTIVNALQSCDSWKKMGRPEPPYIEDQSKNGGPWAVVPLEQRLIGRIANLLITLNSGGEPNLVTVSESEYRNRSTWRSYRIILPKVGNNC
jgi:hypothetical protein